MAIKFLLDLVTTVIVAIFVLRFLLQLTRADFYNPASQAIVKFTNPLVLPLRKIIPGWGGLDLASIVAAIILQAAALTLIVFYDAGLRGFPMPPWTAIALRTPIRFWRWAALPTWGVGMALLVATLVFGLEANGARRWLPQAASARAATRP